MPDQPWVDHSARGSLAPPATTDSEDDYQPNCGQSNMPEIPPPAFRLQKRHTQHAAPPPPPPKATTDHERPPTRHSKMLIFKQVKSMLHKPSKLDMSRISRPSPPVHSRSAGPSTTTTLHSGRAIRDGYEVRRHAPEHEDWSSADATPVSALRHNDMERSVPPGSNWGIVDSEAPPVSGIADFAYYSDMPVSSQLSTNRDWSAPTDTPCPTVKVINIPRKPAPRSISHSQNIPPPLYSPSPPPSRDTDAMSLNEITRLRSAPDSRFSWTTYAASEMCAPYSYDLASRPSIDRPFTGHSVEAEVARYEGMLAHARDGGVISRFSWSTSHTAGQKKPVSPPPSPPPVPSPTKHTAPPVQSILSRHRPIQRHQEREEWIPPPRKSSATADAALITRLKVDMLHDDRQHLLRYLTDDNPGSASKNLPPLPPDPTSTTSPPKTRAEELLAKETEIIFQRKNIEKAIVENAKIESASPLEVTFAEVRAAKKDLENLRGRLEEIKLEERDIGIAIARARRKEGGDDSDALWVRRATE